MNKSLWFYYCIPIIDRERKLEENDDSTLYATFFFLIWYGYSGADMYFLSFSMYINYTPDIMFSAIPSTNR